MKERLKSPVLWSSLFAVIYILIAPSLGFPDWAEISTQVIALIYSIFGVANNPSDRENF